MIALLIVVLTPFIDSLFLVLEERDNVGADDSFHRSVIAFNLPPVLVGVMASHELYVELRVSSSEEGAKPS